MTDRLPYTPPAVTATRAKCANPPCHNEARYQVDYETGDQNVRVSQALCEPCLKRVQLLTRVTRVGAVSQPIDLTGVDFATFFRGHSL